jgi:hypothetical protein
MREGDDGRDWRGRALHPRYTVPSRPPADATVELAPELELPPWPNFVSGIGRRIRKGTAQVAAPVSQSSTCTSESRGRRRADRKRSLRERILAGYVRMMVGAARIVIGGSAKKSLRARGHIGVTQPSIETATVVLLMPIGNPSGLKEFAGSGIRP